MRQAVLQAIAHHSWPECLPLTETAAQDDTDPDVRRFARLLLQHPGTRG